MSSPELWWATMPPMASGSIAGSEARSSIVRRTSKLSWLVTDERSTLMSWRVAALALGILIAGAGAPAVVDAVGGGRGGYLAMSAFVAVLRCPLEPA